MKNTQENMNITSDRLTLEAVDNICLGSRVKNYKQNNTKTKNILERFRKTSKYH